jgi:hypothetical protein
MTLGELIARLVEQGVVSLHSTPEGLELNTALDRIGVDPETPIPIWNEGAGTDGMGAWEI